MVDNTRIEVYRANIANPEDLPDLRFWLQNELVKIQSGFVSVDEVIGNIVTIVEVLIESGGLQGDPGESGSDGKDGVDGVDGVGIPGEDGQDATAADLIDDNRELYDKTWSSRKIAQEIVDALVNQLLGTHQDVVIVNPLDSNALMFDAADSRWKNKVARNESWPTGLINGGELNIGPGINDIEVVAGQGVIVDSYTAPDQQPVFTGVDWAQINEPITASPSVAGSLVYFTIDITGVLKQYATAPDEALRRDEIFVGLVIHNGDTWGEISSPMVINNAVHTLGEFLKRVAGPTFVIDGGHVSEQPLFTLNQEAGTLWEQNRNWHVDKKNPHRENFLARTPIQFKYINRDFSTVVALTSTVDPTTWDNNGSVESVPFPAGSTTIQRMYIDPRDNLWMLYGQNVYSSFDEAQALIGADTADTVLPEILGSSILLGYIVCERNKSDWDIDEARFIVPGDGGVSGAAGAPITEHDLLTGINPDNHHDQLHPLYGSDHSDVDITTPLDIRDGLFFNGTKLAPDRRTRYIPGGYVGGASYQRGDEVSNGSQISEALIDGAVESPYIAPTGDPEYAYQGTLTEAPVSAKQIYFGARYTMLEGGYATGIRVLTTIGNHYETYLVKDPLGSPEAVLVASFTATIDGITTLPVGSKIVAAGTVFDAITLVSEPDPTPTVLTLNYNYLTPQNIGVPAVGEISHGRGNPDTMRVNKTANNGSLPLLSIGDIIDGAGVRWSVQAVTDSGAYWTFIVAPSSTGSAGTQDFDFETVVATPITVGSDTDYWLTGQPGFATVQGLYIVDGAYLDIVPDNTAHGTDVQFQEAYVPTEWAVKVLASGSGGGGGGSFTPDVFTGAGSTGYAPDPVTETGKFLSDDGLWKDVDLNIDGGFANAIFLPSQIFDGGGA